MPTTPKFTLPYPAATDPADVPLDMNKLATRIDTIGGAASGIATLDAGVKVPVAQLPAGVANGVASLDGTTRIPIAQLPTNVGRTLAGLYSSRPAANSVVAGTIYYAFDTVGVWLSDGTQWTLVDQGEALINASDLGSAPFSPGYDGSRIRYFVDTTAGISWGFRYWAASPSAYKWHFAGGPAQRVVSASFSTLTATGAFVNYGLGIVCARGGDYKVSYSASLYCIAGGGSVYASVAKGTGSVAGAADIGAQVIPAVGTIVQLSMEAVVANVAPGQALYEILLAPSGANLQLANRSFSITPIRVT